MLAVEGCNDLPAIEVGEADNWHFREAELCLDACRHRPDCRFVDTTAEDWRDFNLYLDPVGVHDQLSYGFLALRRARANFGPGNSVLDFPCDPAHRSIDFLERRC